MANDLGSLGGSYSYAQGINDSGVIVGRSEYTTVTANASVFHAYFTNAQNVMQDLGSIGKNTKAGSNYAYSSEAYAINNNGTVVGRSHYSNDVANGVNFFVPFRLKLQNGETTLTPQDTLLWSKYNAQNNRLIATGIANAVNNRDIMVGQFNVVSPIYPEAFLGTDKLYNISEYVTNLGTWHLDLAKGINDDGVIVGYGTPDKSNTAVQHAFLLTPISATVTGSLAFEFLDPSAPAQNVTFTFRKPGASDYVVTKSVSSSGSVNLPDVPAGLYTLHISAPRYLSLNVPNVDLRGTGFTLTTDLANLLAGDTDSNNVVDVDDLTTLLFAFNTVKGDGSGLYEAYPTGDINQDGKIDVDDLTDLLFNFNISGDN